jgi:hypothetical protein
MKYISTIRNITVAKVIREPITMSFLSMSCFFIFILATSIWQPTQLIKENPSRDGGTEKDFQFGRKEQQLQYTR